MHHHFALAFFTLVPQFHTHGPSRHGDGGFSGLVHLSVVVFFSPSNFLLSSWRCVVSPFPAPPHPWLSRFQVDGFLRDHTFRLRRYDNCSRNFLETFETLRLLVKVLVLFFCSHLDSRNFAARASQVETYSWFHCGVLTLKLLCWILLVTTLSLRP